MSEQPGSGADNPWARPRDEQGEGPDVQPTSPDPMAPPTYPTAELPAGGFAAPDAAAPDATNPWSGFAPVEGGAGPSYPTPAGPYPPPAGPYAPQPDPYAPQPRSHGQQPGTYPPAPAYPPAEGYPATAVPYPTTAVPGYGAPPGYPAPVIYGDPGFGAASAGAAAPYNLDAYGMPIPVRTDPMAGTSMGLGIGSLTLSVFSCCCWPLEAVWLVGGLVAVALGLISKRNIAAQPLHRSGSGYAVAGIVTGAIAATVAVLFLLLAGLGVVAGQGP